VAWIDTSIHPEHAAALTPLFVAHRDPDTGQVDNILTVHALHPAGLSAHLALYTAVMRGTPTLRKVEREMIAVVVSATNGCRY
jgi:alkylhydroperoxidase family enzyme